MIFVTVGTHEQQFNRLIEYMDDWASKNEEAVVIQTGFSTYIPVNCQSQALFPYKEMVEKVSEARIVITHGGPSSFIMPLQIGKVPIVVPRRKDFDEHVNNHQVDFCNAVAERQHNIIVVNDVKELSSVLLNYDNLVEKMNHGLQSNNAHFCDAFEKMVNEIL